MFFFPRPNNKIHPMEVPGSKPTVTRNPSLDVIPPPNRPTIARNPSLETPTKTVAGSRKASPRGETPERNPPLTRIVYIKKYKFYGQSLIFTRNIIFLHSAYKFENKVEINIPGPM